jgi:type I restriction enzyme S subunit
MNMAWSYKKLEEVLVLNRSGYWGDDAATTTRPILVKVIRNADITKDNSIKGSISRYFSSKEATNAELRVGDIAMSSSGDVGKAWLVNEAGYSASNFIRILRPASEMVLPSFLKYVLESADGQSTLASSTAGTTIQNLQKSFYSKLTIPLPPLSEQQRIVRLLDEAFEEIAIAKANAEKNLQNARSIFESHVQSVFTQGSDAWNHKRLGEISKIQYGYTESSSTTKVGPHFLRITDIQDNRVNWDTVPYCPIAASEFRKFQLHDGDIVFARTGATTGKSYLIADPPESVFASYLIRVQIQEQELLPAFLNLYFQTQLYWDVIRAGVAGSAQGGFNAKKLADLLIPFPQSIEDQRSLVDKGELLASRVRDLKVVYERKNAALDALLNSLLERALSGPLKAA